MVQVPQRVMAKKEIVYMKIFTWKEQLGRSECPYMERWVLNLRLFSIRLHHWYSSDDPRYRHDHQWNFLTFILKGGYTDVTDSCREKMSPGTIKYRSAIHKHTTEVWPGGCWTIIITGPIIRKWGFWVNGKFKKSNKFFLEHGHHPCVD